MLHESQQWRQDAEFGLHIRLQGRHMPALSTRSSPPRPFAARPATPALHGRVHSLC